MEGLEKKTNEYIGYPPEIDESITTTVRRSAFKDGYKMAMKSFAEMVKQYEEKGRRCYEQSEDNHESAHCFYWDGFKNCAENISRELSDE